jgi:hypothetical protein
VVAETDLHGFARIARSLGDRWIVNDPIEFGDSVMGSFVSIDEVGKVDLILDRGTPWSRSAMDRRQRWDHPAFGLVWVLTLEDLVIAKLAWSDGSSELQLRDCRNLVRVNEAGMDWVYLERWAEHEGLSGLLVQVRHAP